VQAAVPASLTAAHSHPRPNRLLTAGIAALGAGALAVSPVVPAETVTGIEERGVALTAGVNPLVTDDPAVVYGNLVNKAFENLAGLVTLWAADPFPITRQVGSNLVDYATRIVEGYLALPAAFQNFWDGDNGKAMLDEAWSALLRGEIAEAYDRLNRFQVYSLTIWSPLAGWMLSQDPNPRNPQGRLGIPEQIAQNLTQVIHAIFNQGSVVNGSIKTVWGLFIGMNFELALAADAILDGLRTGDLGKIVTTLVNVPGTVLNAFLNGYGDPTCTVNCEAARFPGLINAVGPLVNFFVEIPRAIAAALQPDAPAAANGGAASQGVAEVSRVVLPDETELLNVDPSGSEGGPAFTVAVSDRTPAAEEETGADEIGADEIGAGETESPAEGEAVKVPAGDEAVKVPAGDEAVKVPAGDDGDDADLERAAKELTGADDDNDAETGTAGSGGKAGGSGSGATGSDTDPADTDGANDNANDSDNDTGANDANGDDD